MQLPEPDPRFTREGIAAVTLDDLRWGRCDIKATTLLPNVLGLGQARDEGADEAIFVRDGKAIEGTASNLFIVNSGLLITPPNSQWLLPGVTRDLVLELAEQAGLPYAEASIGVLDLDFAEEIWLTSSTREVVPVTQLNGRPVGNGEPGPYWHRMQQLFSACKQHLRAGGECRT
jgi:D-alanine transaminase